MKKHTEVMKDFGRITIPTRWEEMTLGQFEDLMRASDGNTENLGTLKILSILTGKDEEYIKGLPSEFVQTLISHVMFLSTEPKEYEKPKNEIKVGGDRYVINFMEKLSFGEYLTVVELLKNDNYCYSKILAVLCRREGEKFDDDFENNVYKNRADMMNGLPVTTVMPLIAFFLNLYLTSSPAFQKSLTDAKRTTNQLLRHTVSSLLRGGGRKHSMRWRITTLLKLRKLKQKISRI